MAFRILSIALLALALAAGTAQAQQQAPQRGGCASGFCSMSNAPQEQAGDIDAVEAEMKRQMAGQPRPQSAMGMCPCMRMMAMMMRGGMGGMGMGGMGGMGGMQSMPGMSHPMPGMQQPQQPQQPTPPPAQ